jgi:flagellar biosynthetic protein FliP
VLRRLLVATALVAMSLLAASAFAQPAHAQTAPTAPTAPTAGPTIATPAGPAAPQVKLTDGAADPNADASISIDLGGGGGKPSQGILVIVLLTLLSVAPAILVLATSFTRIVIVLSLTRNALGLQGIPPNQVLVGLALFLSLFVMAPTFTQVNDLAVQPLLRGEKTQGQAWDAAVVPMRRFMLDQTHEGELAMFTTATDQARPATPDDVKLTTLLPAFMLSELKTAFIIGFVIFIPFLVIDIVVSSALMSMGMMMLPPVVVSLPFKLLLFVLVDGWGLVVKSLVQSFH